MRSHESAGDRTDWTAQLSGSLLMRSPFEIAQDDGCPVMSRKASQLLFEYIYDLVRAMRYFAPGFGHSRHLLFPGSTTCGSRAGFEGGASSDFIEPPGDDAARPNRASLPRQHEKSRLKRILRLLLMSQDTATNSQHHRPMPTNEIGESRFVPRDDEALQKLPIARRS